MFYTKCTLTSVNLHQAICTFTQVLYIRLLYTYITSAHLHPLFTYITQAHLHLLFTYTCCLLTPVVYIIYSPSNSSSKNILTTISIFRPQLFIQCISLHLRSRHPGVAPFLQIPACLLLIIVITVKQISRKCVTSLRSLTCSLLVDLLNANDLLIAN